MAVERVSRICSLTGCEKRRFSKDYCLMHYKRWKRHGDPLGGRKFVGETVLCSVEGCNRVMHAKTYCTKHYVRFKIYGNALEPLQVYQELTPETFWVRVAVTADDTRCWEWQGARSPLGYGSVGQNGKVIRAHRYALSLATGAMPDDLCVLHLCDNPPCCNPKHLRWGTLRENNEDAWQKGRMKRGEAVYNARLTANQVKAIRRDTRPRPVIAKEFGVSVSTVQGVQTRKNWKHVE